jgi:excisionase family DNA binding protein
MSAIVDALLAELDDQALDRLAQLLAPRLADQLEGPSAARPWLNARQAADYIAAPVSRIHDLVQLGVLEPRRDGRRLLFRSADLDAYLEAASG